MSKYLDLAKEIVNQVGGKENINSLTHCVTRLRFQLKDESKANDEILKNMDGVVTVMHSAGQYQVVIGNHVGEVYEDVCEIANISSDSSTNTSEAPKGIFNKLISVISGCFQPILGPLCACGIIKGLNALLVFILGASFAESGTYQVLNAIGDSIFYFMPIILGYSAAKTFKLSPPLGIAIGAALCYPNIQLSQLSSAGEAIGSIPLIGDYYTTFLGIPLVAGNYISTVIPILVIVCLASWLQKVGKKIIPEMLQAFFVPVFVLIVSVPIGLLVIGPVVSALTNLLTIAITSLYEFSPILTGTVLGFFQQVFIIFGVHWALVPIAMISLTTLGYNAALVGVFGTTFAQTGAVLGMYFRLKDKKKKNLAIPAIVSGVCGVTEPAIYGLSLPAKKPFYFSMIGGAVGGAILAAFDAKTYTMGGMGIFGVVNFISPSGDASGMYAAFLCIAVSTLVGFGLTYLFWRDSSEAKVEVSNKDLKLDKEIVACPINGIVKPLSSLEDKAFAQEALGKGVAIVPTDGKVYAPFDGTAMTVFPTKHAIGIVSDNGCEVLIHIGLDTVQLNGKHFKTHISQGDTVKKGQLLVSFDKMEIEKEGYCLDTPVIITNTNDYLDIISTTNHEVKHNDSLITAIV